MKSKPVYSALILDSSARRHVFVVQGDGAVAPQRVLAANPTADGVVAAWDDPAGGEAVLGRILAESGMDTAFYLAGPEVFLWQVTRLLRNAGIEQRRIRQELAGSQARSVYCVHCGTTNESVTTTVYRCAGCQMALTVRDHFSRPRGAYMGVIIDAETPGLVPEPERLYA